MEVRNVSDDCCCSYRRGCVEVDMWVCYVKWKKSEKGDGVVLRLICGYAT